MRSGAIVSTLLISFSLFASECLAGGSIQLSKGAMMKDVPETVSLFKDSELRSWNKVFSADQIVKKARGDLGAARKYYCTSYHMMVSLSSGGSAKRYGRLGSALGDSRLVGLGKYCSDRGL